MKLAALACDELIQSYKGGRRCGIDDAYLRRSI
jgi:hypothetical protein